MDQNQDKSEFSTNANASHSGGHGQGSVANRAPTAETLSRGTKTETVKTKSKKAKSDGPTEIKRYKNRKLYNSCGSLYVTLSDVRDMIRAKEDFHVVDGKTGEDITQLTLIQIIYKTERNLEQFAPVDVLKDIVNTGDGTFSSYLAHLGLFSEDNAKKQIKAQKATADDSRTEAPQKPQQKEEGIPPASFEDVKQTLQERVVKAVNQDSKNDDGAALKLPTPDRSFEDNFSDKS